MKKNERLPIENRPIEELKKRADQPVDFSALIDKALRYNVKKKKK